MRSPATGSVDVDAQPGGQLGSEVEQAGGAQRRPRQGSDRGDRTQPGRAQVDVLQHRARQPQLADRGVDEPDAAQFGADLTRVAVVGESAGGNLAINVAMAAREGRTPLPVAMGLIYPLAGTDMTTPSYQQNAMARPLNAAMMQWFFRQATSLPAELQDPRLNVYGRAELRGLPKAIIVTAEIDPLRSDGMLLGQRLQQSGVQVVAQDFAGVTHEFFGVDPNLLAQAGAAQRFMAGELRSAFALPAPAVVVPTAR